MPEPKIKLRCTVGRFAGQVIGYPKSVAENLLATGHAEYPDGEEETISAETTTPPPGETRAEWPLKSGPEEYLKRYPDGPRADLARQIVAEE